MKSFSCTFVQWDEEFMCFLLGRGHRGLPSDPSLLQIRGQVPHLLQVGVAAFMFSVSSVLSVLCTFASFHVNRTKSKISYWLRTEFKD